jgi:hypothetical protein
MLIVKRQLLVGAALLVALVSAGLASAQLSTRIPASIRDALEAPDANVAAMAISFAQSNPLVATPLLDMAVNRLGLASEAAANETMAFADRAAKLIEPGGNEHNPALAAALAVAVENVVGNPQNAALINGPYAAIVAAAKAKADKVLEDAEVQQAILDHAPGTEDVLQAAVGGSPGGFGSFGGAGGGVGGTPVAAGSTPIAQGGPTPPSGGGGGTGTGGGSTPARP